MQIIEILALDNGAHRNQNGDFRTIPEGWAVVNCETPNFPFGTPTVEEINGVMTVTAWEAGEMPEPEPAPEAEPTLDERVSDLEGENALLKAQISAQSEQMDFYEDCIAEMAMMVYA